MIVIDRLSIHAGAFRLDNVSFKVPAGKYGVLMGKTGCGKTTILEAVIGLRSVNGGSIRLYQDDVTHWNPAARGVGYVPQDGALFAGMSVRDHLAFALDVRGVARKRIEDRVAELADLLGIEHLLKRTPQGLSGGERQRVALGRALSFRPRILCLDEPLSALDADTRTQMFELLKSVQRHTHVTTLHVTHHFEEAQQLGDCWFRIQGGKVVESKNAGQPTSEPSAEPVAHRSGVAQ